MHPQCERYQIAMEYPSLIQYRTEWIRYIFFHTGKTLMPFLSVSPLLWIQTIPDGHSLNSYGLSLLQKQEDFGFWQSNRFQTSASASFAQRFHIPFPEDILPLSFHPSYQWWLSSPKYRTWLMLKVMKCLPERNSPINPMTAPWFQKLDAILKGLQRIGNTGHWFNR